MNNIHQINWYNQTLRFSCSNIGVPDIEKFNIQQMRGGGGGGGGVICNSSRILIKHMMSIQAKKIQKFKTSNKRCSPYKFVKLINQTLRFSCNIVIIYGGNSLYHPQGGLIMRVASKWLWLFNYQWLLFALLDWYNQTLRSSSLWSYMRGFIMIHYIWRLSLLKNLATDCDYFTIRNFHLHC